VFNVGSALKGGAMLGTLRASDRQLLETIGSFGIWHERSEVDKILREKRECQGLSNAIWNLPSPLELKRKGLLQLVLSGDHTGRCEEMYFLTMKSVLLLELE
jgi:hypothetical protein